jgi:zinc protease
MMTRLLLGGCGVILALGSLAAEQSPPAPVAKALPFAHETSDLKPDPAVRFGKLPNGMRYAVLPNKEPKGRTSLRLLVLAGSLHETEEQRGVAHFLEHLAFNGSVNYPPGTLVEFFQRMGMSFGGDTNANTGHERTVYLLELARSDEKTIAEGLRVMGDYAGGLLLLPEEIEKEREVILSERRARDSVGYRTFVAQYEAMLGTTLLPKRLPIGVPEVISGAGRERFTDFWNTWYRPERMAVVAVGDFEDAAQTEKMINEAFARLKERGPVRPEPALGELPKFDGVRPVYHSEPEAPSTDVAITRITPYTPEEDTAKNRIKELPRWLALSILNRRFSILAKKENAPFISARAGVFEQFDFLRQSSINVTCQPATWQAALGLGEQELRRALEFGFTSGELKEAAAGRGERPRAGCEDGQHSALSTARRRHRARPARWRSLHAPHGGSRVAQAGLEKVTLNDCVEALRRDFGATGRFVTVTGNTKIEGDAAAAITGAYETSARVAVSAPATREDSEWAYTDFGPAGTIAQRERVEDLGIELVTFANGARLNIKKTDFEAGRIGLQARVGNGSITEPADQRGLAGLAGSTFTAGGLGKHSVDDLRRILAGRNVGFQFRPEADALVFSGGTTPEDLALQLQLLAAHITDPGYRPEALRQARKGLEQLYTSFEHTPNGPLATEVANLLANGDPRFGMPAKEVMLARNLEELKAWLSPQLQNGALEIAVAGDLDVEATIAAAAKTIGALPAREVKPELPHLKKVKFPEKPFAKDYTIASEIPKGSLQLYWPSNDGLEASRQRRLSLLATVFNDRLRVKIREELGASYSPRAASNPSDVFAGYGYFNASVDVDPATAQKVADLVTGVADDLARNGVTEEELLRARQPVLTAIQESMRTNGYWIGAVLSRAQEKPQVLEWARTRMADVQSITPAELSGIAREYLGRERVSRATVLPAK